MSGEMQPVPLTLIVAATRTNHAIGRASSLPWRLSNEMAYFARMTKGELGSDAQSSTRHINSVIMGRKSWQGIPSRFRPLPDRVNVVVSRQPDYELGESGSNTTHLANSIEGAINLLRTRAPDTNRHFLIGGAQLYNEALSSSSSRHGEVRSTYLVDRVLLTRIDTDYPDCDTFLNPFMNDTETWRRANHEELVEWAGWQVPQGIQREKDKLVKGSDKWVEYEFEMWVRKSQ
ncbi:dihydrofolate reductase [Sporobolomyces koalae]|uniref:dihydrofolate reductase n=1 Tax=Sporobolomyces koalae TaxID=500713 RepID=UPI0031772519